ncbi:MAG: NADH-quinone oxidoreductase subunit C [Gammaproteobacteria bacterium]|nr:NADH-quinone oxidoreductase subunit C [Gammaproteobacteria bacterium]
MADSQTLAAKLREYFSDIPVDCTVNLKEVTLEVSPDKVLDVCRALRDEDDFAFEILIDLCGVDYATYGMTEWETDISTDTGFSRGVNAVEAKTLTNKMDTEKPRYAVVYHLLSLANNQRLRVRSYPENSDFPVIDSVHDVWNGVNWFEREAFDLYGIIFDGHPDLRRILSDYGFIGHPFRKDYPLTGHVEMRYDEEKGRVIYQPVSIEPRVLVPRVIRHDNRYDDGQSGEESSNA